MYALGIFGILGASLLYIVLPLTAQSYEWVGFDSFTCRGVDEVYDSAPPVTGEYNNPILAGFYPENISFFPWRQSWGWSNDCFAGHRMGAMKRKHFMFRPS